MRFVQPAANDISFFWIGRARWAFPALQSLLRVNKNFRMSYNRAEIFVYELCVERQIVFGAFFKMRSQHIVLI